MNIGLVGKGDPISVHFGEGLTRQRFIEECKREGFDFLDFFDLAAGMTATECEIFGAHLVVIRSTDNCGSDDTLANAWEKAVQTIYRRGVRMGMVQEKKRQRDAKKLAAGKK